MTGMTSPILLVPFFSDLAIHFQHLQACFFGSLLVLPTVVCMQPLHCDLGHAGEKPAQQQVPGPAARRP